MTQVQEICRPPRVYTDVPAAVYFPTYGATDTDVPCSVLTYWQADQQHFPRGVGTLAIRWTTNGQRHFESDRAHFSVDDQTYLLFNGGREFSSFVESNSLVSCYSIAFDPLMVQDVLHSLLTPADYLIDDPFEGQYQPVQFFETAFRHDTIVSPMLRKLQQAAEKGCEEHGWFGENFRLLLENVLQRHRNIYRHIEGLPAVRAATRIEIYRRVLVARDYMEANLDRPLGVNEIATVACFSPYHFLRIFKQVFQETPHQYLIRRRLERAQSLLNQTDMSITNICFAVGFESLGSFSWLFRKHNGVSPERYRLENSLVHGKAVLIKSESLSPTVRSVPASRGSDTANAGGLILNAAGERQNAEPR
jgi:AraC family transcriptional regulator